MLDNYWTCMFLTFIFMAKLYKIRSFYNCSTTAVLRRVIFGMLWKLYIETLTYIFEVAQFEMKLSVKRWEKAKHSQLWRLWAASCGSSVTDAIRFPISWTISISSPFHEPDVSDCRRKICLEVTLAYLNVLAVAARLAAAPARVAKAVRLHSTNVLWAHGICLVPSVRLPC